MKEKVEIPLDENAVYAVVNGEVFIIPKPPEGFGKQIITWQDGKPLPKAKNESVMEFKKIE